MVAFTHLYLLQDPKATEVSKESQPNAAPIFNPSGQRNPFKVIDKNCEPSLWKQITQGSGDESKAKGVKAERESVLVSHKEKKSSSDSSIEKEPLEGLKTKEQQSVGDRSDPEVKESTVSESKLGLSEGGRGKGRNTPWKEEKYGDSGRGSQKSSECLEKEPGPRSKLFPLSLGEQSTSTKPQEEKQLRKESLKSCGDKETTEKEYSGQKNGEVKSTSKEDVISPAEPQSTLPHAALKGGAEAALLKTQIRPGLGQPAVEGSGSDSKELVFVCSSSGKSKIEKSVAGLQPREIPSGKSGKSIQGDAASHHVEGPQDPKALRNHLVVQLKQKKVIFYSFFCCCSVFRVTSFTHDVSEYGIPAQQKIKIFGWFRKMGQGSELSLGVLGIQDTG